MIAPKTTALISAAAIAAIGLAGAAVAQVKHSHVLELRLPDGSLEQIRYVGDAPPIVRLQAGWAPVVDAWPDEVFGADSPFAALERISAQMDRQAAALLQQASSLPDPLADAPSGLTPIDLGKLPPGVSGYSVVSTMSGGRVCTRTVQYGPAEGSGRPTAVTRISGDCDSSAKGSPPSGQAVSAPEPAAQHPRLQQVSARF